MLTRQMPDEGVLELDFVHLAPLDAKPEVCPYADMKTLQRQIARAISSAVRVELIQQACAAFVMHGDDALNLVRPLPTLHPTASRTVLYLRAPPPPPPSLLFSLPCPLL